MVRSFCVNLRRSVCVSAVMCVSVATVLAGCGGSGANSSTGSGSNSSTATNCPPGQVPVGVAGACAPPSTDTSASSTTQPPTSSQASGSTSPLTLGQSADFAGDAIIGSGAGEKVSVTVQRVIDPITSGVISLGVSAPPPPVGQRRVVVELSIQSTGTSAYSDSPGQELSLISKSTNGPVGQATPGTTGPGQCATDLSVGVNIAAGQTERGCVFFQVPSDQQISAVQYQTQGGEGGNLATWTVP